MRDLETRIIPEKIFFRKHHIVLEEEAKEKYGIPYRDIVWAFIEAGNRGTKGFKEPVLADITEDTEGELVIYDMQHYRWRIRTDRIGRTAGALLKELCIHAPYIVAGGQNWFEGNEKAEFDQVSQMVRCMRECSRE